MTQLHHNGGTLVSRFGGWLSAASTGLANFLIVLFGGIFLATEPRFYRIGAIKLEHTLNEEQQEHGHHHCSRDEQIARLERHRRDSRRR